MSTDPLAAARDHVAQIAGFEGYAAYLDAKSKGLKPAAARSAAGFAAALSFMTPQAAFEAARLIGALRARLGDPPGLVPHPVAAALTRICADRAEADPSSAEPLLLQAVFDPDPWAKPGVAEAALQREPDDPGAIGAVLAVVFRQIDLALHHLGEGELVGDPSDAGHAIDRALDLSRRLPEGEARTAALAEARGAAADLDLWEAWRSEGEPGGFPAYAAARGRPEVSGGVSGMIYRFKP